MWQHAEAWAGSSCTKCHHGEGEVGTKDAEELLVAVVRGSQLSLMVQSWSVDQLGTSTHL